MGVVPSFPSYFLIRTKMRVFLDIVILGEFERTESLDLFWETMRLEVILKGEL